MRIYWYWPHPHRTTSELALGMLRPGDELTVQALPSLVGESFTSVDAYEVVRDLPDPTRPVSRPGRVVRPATIAVGRVRARRRLLRRDFDLRHLHLLTYQHDWLDVPGLRRSGPLVATVHDVRPHRSVLPRALEDAALRRLYRDGGADRLVVYHRVLGEELVADFGVAPERVVALPIPWFPADAGGRRRPRRDRPRALLFGRLAPYKGITDLVAAARLLGPDDLGFDLAIVGAGDAEVVEDVRALAASTPWVSARIERVSKEEQVQLVADADLIVLPYASFHSQSGVLADAYANRVPILVTDVGAIGPTVREDGTGWVVPPRDPDALARGLVDAMGAISAGDDRRDALEVARLRHQAEAVGGQLRTLYDDVVRDPVS